jgi:hypothetical protein
MPSVAVEVPALADALDGCTLGANGLDQVVSTTSCGTAAAVAGVADQDVDASRLVEHLRDEGAVPGVSCEIGASRVTWRCRWTGV